MWCLPWVKAGLKAALALFTIPPIKGGIALQQVGSTPFKNSHNNLKWFHLEEYAVRPGHPATWVYTFPNSSYAMKEH